MFEARLPGEIPTFETRSEAEKSVDKHIRYGQILDILGTDNRYTAKEMAVEMFQRGFTPDMDRNNAAPRLTELCQEGKVEVIGKTICDWTGKKVSVYQRRLA